MAERSSVVHAAARQLGVSGWLLGRRFALSCDVLDFGHGECGLAAGIALGPYQSYLVISGVFFQVRRSGDSNLGARLFVGERVAVCAFGQAARHRRFILLAIGSLL